LINALKLQARNLNEILGEIVKIQPILQTLRKQRSLLEKEMKISTEILHGSWIVAPPHTCVMMSNDLFTWRKKNLGRKST
jgi:hypothetical protein